MIKQKVFFSGAVLAIFLSLSNVSLASGLDKNMQSLAKSMSILQSSNDKSSLSNTPEMMYKSEDPFLKFIPDLIDVNYQVSVYSHKEE